jgi:hypothetical protein
LPLLSTAMPLPSSLPLPLPPRRVEYTSVLPVLFSFVTNASLPPFVLGW